MTVSPFLRHIERCHNIALPSVNRTDFIAIADRQCGDIAYTPLFYNHHGEESLIGWVSPELLPFLKTPSCRIFLDIETHPGFSIISLPAGKNLEKLSDTLINLNCFTPFHEYFDIRTGNGDVIGRIDRGLIPLIGAEAEGIHLNGLVIKNDVPYLWVATRSRNKRLDPGKLDHLVAGGMSAGLTPKQTLIKESIEEAALAEHYSSKAQKTALLRYAMQRPEGLRRDRIHCYDLLLPEDFLPHATDKEVENFQLLTLEEVFKRVRDTDDFKFNVNLVLIDLFLRYGFFTGHEERSLRHALDYGLAPASCSHIKKGS